MSSVTAPAAPPGRLRRLSFGERLERGLGVLLGIDPLVVRHALRALPAFAIWRTTLTPPEQARASPALGSFVGALAPPRARGPPPGWHPPPAPGHPPHGCRGPRCSAAARRPQPSAAGLRTRPRQ